MITTNVRQLIAALQNYDLDLPVIVAVTHAGGSDMADADTISIVTPAFWTDYHPDSVGLAYDKGQATAVCIWTSRGA